MKISEELQDLYRSIRTDRWNAGGWKLIADALQQAVAESLKANAWMAWLLNDKKGPSPSLMGDWLAEADKLLRGEK